ncbi:MAG: hypothetical protein LBT11_01075 [Treponema sp.]|nr:hypothetical protein [Treponema sp.]
MRDSDRPQRGHYLALPDYWEILAAPSGATPSGARNPAWAGLHRTLEDI